MKEYKFRFYSNDAQRYLDVIEIWVKSNKFTVQYGNTSQIAIVDGIHQLEEFTGLTDKNGTDIFEGDIIESRTGQLAEIIYNHGSFYLKFIKYEKEHALDDGTLGFEYYNPDISIVIGNIHENKDLLS
jgi:uncharacterized phage protein (TIGR01671 family)